MRNIWKTRPDSYTITFEQKVQFQLAVKKNQLDKIQNCRPAATFDFNMHNNWTTVPDS